MNIHRHHVSGFFVQRKEAEATLAILVSRGLAREQLQIFDTSVTAAPPEASTPHQPPTEAMPDQVHTQRGLPLLQIANSGRHPASSNGPRAVLHHVPRRDVRHLGDLPKDRLDDAAAEEHRTSVRRAGAV